MNLSVHFIDLLVDLLEGEGEGGARRAIRVVVNAEHDAPRLDGHRRGRRRAHAVKVRDYCLFHREKGCGYSLGKRKWKQDWLRLASRLISVR